MSHRTFVLAFLVMVASSTALLAATKAERQKAAEALVKEALQREVYGMTAERKQLLEQASKTAPDYAPAMWHRGYVRHKNEWIKAEDFAQISSDDPRMVQYTTIRPKYKDTPQDQMALANWCAKRGLSSQERAHLTKVVSLDADHPEARERLGFRRVDGAWMRAGEIGDRIKDLQADRVALAEWRPKVEAILKGLTQRGELKRNAAKEKLAAIKDGSAVLALETILSARGSELSLLVLKTLDAMEDNEATLSIARHAVQSPWPQVRQAASQMLKSHTKDVYVPSMLSAMYTPVQTRMELYAGPGGRMCYRHSFFREGQSEKQLMVMETAYKRIARVDGDRRDAEERALTDIQRSALNAEQAALQENLRTQEFNTRIADALATATGEKLPASPEAWWQWWNEYNEVFVEGQKQIRTLEQTREVKIVDRVSPDAITASGGGQGNSQRGLQGRRAYPMDCLAAGTLIWTANGLMAVDKIQVGDMVLSKDAESGELAYKPVLRTTVRPKSILVKLLAGTQAIETSGGHPFWVSGEGWTKARELEPGMELHTVAGSTQISKIERSREEQTYNLIVADFNTYFIGEAKILSHDNTIRETTEIVVPGLTDQ